MNAPAQRTPSPPREPTHAMEAVVLRELEWIRDDAQRKAHLDEYKRRWRLMWDAAREDAP